MSMVRKLPNLFVNLHQTALGRLRKWVSDAYSIRAGAVPNRTYRVGAKRLQTAPTQGYLVLGFRVYFITNVSAICLF